LKEGNNDDIKTARRSIAHISDSRFPIGSHKNSVPLLPSAKVHDLENLNILGPSKIEVIPIKDEQLISIEH
jgi:hypothetical protein